MLKGQFVKEMIYQGGLIKGAAERKKKKMISLIADSLIHKFGNHLQI